MQRIQILSTDLSEILRIGTIQNMWVADIEGHQVLRIEYSEHEDTAIVPYKQEYATVQRQPARASKPVTRKPASKPARKAPEKKKSNPVVDGFKAWWNNKEPPDFMTREFRKW